MLALCKAFGLGKKKEPDPLSEARLSLLMTSITAEG
jgi:hypothetical protein